MNVVKYEAGVPASVRAFCDKRADRIESVMAGSRRDSWRYMAYTRRGWNQGDDCVHSVIGSSANDFIAALRRVDVCDCDDCKAGEQGDGK